MDKTIVHAFEERGLGKAPFTFVREIDLGFGGPKDNCHFCGQMIRYLEVIRSSDGKEFHVGCNCVEKTGDKGLIDVVKRERSRLRAQAKWEKQRAEAEAEAQRQRDRNGGMTDWEVKEHERRKAAEEAIARCTSENGWLIEVLEAGHSMSDWKREMVYQLKRQPASSFSERNRSIFADIYARQFGRRNSKAYTEAEECAWSRMNPAEGAA